MGTKNNMMSRILGRVFGRIFGLLLLGLVLAMSGALWAGDDPGMVEPPAVEGAPGEFTFAAVVESRSRIHRSTPS